MKKWKSRLFPRPPNWLSGKYLRLPSSAMFLIDFCLCVPWTTPFQCKILMVEFIVGFYDFCLALEVQYRTSKLFLCGQPSPRRSLGIQQQALKLACLSPTLLESSSCVDPPGNTAGSRMPSSSNCIK
nr:RecName: Full=Uncharacterized protein C16orf97 [Homo sapiens]|eukprot:NP_001229402.1 uncharacterized protein C16orf97 [Homo sapiens]